jgi:16S rRNA (guanine966-N2)-methyltransferase
VNRLSGRYTLVLADPPYYDDAASRDAGALEAVSAVAGSALVDLATVLVLEHHRSRQAPGALGPLPLYRERRHGDTVVSIYAREDAA